MYEGLEAIMVAGGRVNSRQDALESVEILGRYFISNLIKFTSYKYLAFFYKNDYLPLNYVICLVLGSSNWKYVEALPQPRLGTFSAIISRNPIL